MDTFELPPPAELIDKEVVFGLVTGENRGDNASTTLRYLNDPYFWMRHISDPKVYLRLQEENVATIAATARLASFRAKLFEELKGHTKQTDVSQVYIRGPWQYYHRTFEGLGYPVHYRQPTGSSLITDPEVVVVDTNSLFDEDGASPFSSISEPVPSPSQKLFAFTYDLHTTRGEKTDLFVKGFTDDAVKGCAKIDSVQHKQFCWGADDSELFLITEDDSIQVWRFDVGNGSRELLYEESEDGLSVSIRKTLDNEFVIISVEQAGRGETIEVYFVDLSIFRAKVKVIARREPNLFYKVDHRNGWFFIVANHNKNVNFALAVAPVSLPGRNFWRPIKLVTDQSECLGDKEWNAVFANGYDDTPGAVMVDNVTCFKDRLVVQGRADGRSKCWVLELNSSNGQYEAPSVQSCYKLCFFDESGFYKLGDNEFDSPKLKFIFNSAIVPLSIYEYYPKSRNLGVIHQQEVPNYSRSDFRTERIEVKSRDGFQIPVSITFHKSLVMEGLPGSQNHAVILATSPLHLYGYGAYGICCDEEFDVCRLPLLNRGVICATAHVRGGGEMGQSWYNSGRLLSKMNTFEDFIACAEEVISNLQARGWTTPEQTVIEGRSAGGLLVGAVLNMRPDLFKAAVAGVPFVDVMTTMCDSSIPLTVAEWREWGNPNSDKYFESMFAYSPINNVKKQRYPAIFVSAGFRDNHVPFWESMKWVATIRKNKTDTNPVLLQVDIDADHYRPSDRYRLYHDKCMELTFLLDQLHLRFSPTLRTTSDCTKDKKETTCEAPNHTSSRSSSRLLSKT